jgi:hypothetical protein
VRHAFDQLLREALARIPAYQPDWTDVREHDPGVVLVELFAFLAEELAAAERRARRRRRLLVVAGLASLVLVAWVAVRTRDDE